MADRTCLIIPMLTRGGTVKCINCFVVVVENPASGKLIGRGWRTKKSPNCDFCAVIREKWCVYTYSPEHWVCLKLPTDFSVLSNVLSTLAGWY